MRKVFLFMMVTVNGYFEGANHDISWHNAGSEAFERFVIDNLSNTNTLVFGRRTYDLMAEFWPSEQAVKSEPETAKIMSEYRKLVFTTTPLSDTWRNVEVSNNVATKMTQLKSEPGTDIAVLGSSNLCVSLLREGLLDELRIMVNPLVIPNGTALFDGIETRYIFELTDTRTFDDGNVLLTYRVRK